MVPLAILLCGACDDGLRTARETIVPFLNAVQAEDLDGLFCLVAGAAESAAAGETVALEQFRQWARERYEDYNEGRDRGRVELDDQGLVLIKLYALGKGTFFKYTAVRPGGADVLVVETELRFGYAHLDLSRLSPGTTFYVAVAPAGRVRSVRIPHRSSEITVELLESAKVEWTLVRSAAAGGCPEGWTVASAEPVAGSERTTEVTWIF